MDRKRSAVVAGVAVLGLAVASCGGASSEPMTRAEFTKQAGTICGHRQAAFAAVIARSRGDARRGMRAALPELERSVEELGRLRPPAELKRNFDEILALERHQVVITKALLSTGRILPGATEDGAPLHRHERMRRAMGMAACDL